jgi:hypothetical protein
MFAHVLGEVKRLEGGIRDQGSGIWDQLKATAEPVRAATVLVAR